MLFIFFIAILISILQVSAVPYARIGHTTFNLQVITLVFFSLRYGLRVGVAFGLSFGLLSGLFSTGPFWPHLLLYVVVGSIIGYIGKWFYRESILTFLLMLLGSLAFIYFFNIPVYFFSLFLPTAAYNIAISIFLFYFLRKCFINWEV